MLPPAPTRLSTTTDWFHIWPSFCAIKRATMSVVPPAANGTTKVTGRAGHACCACTLLASGIDSQAAATESSVRRIVHVIPVFSFSGDQRQCEREPGCDGDAGRARDPVLAQSRSFAEFDHQEPRTAHHMQGEQHHKAPLRELEKRRFGEPQEA